MKRTIILLLFLFQVTGFANGQSKDSLKCGDTKEMEMNLSVVQASLLANKFYGIKWNFEYYPAKRFGTGIYVIACQKKISDTFTYHIQRPIVNYYEVGWISQYNFIQSKSVRTDISLVNAFAQSRLGDNAIKQKNHKNQPKEIASDYFYLFEPGAGISVRLNSQKDEAGLWLTSATNYRFVFGKSKYSSTNEFSGYLFGIGLSIIGAH